MNEDNKEFYKQYTSDNCKLFTMGKPGQMTEEVWKYYSSEPLWVKGERVVCLLGDVWFSDDAIESIFEHPSQDWLAFGRTGPSILTGCRYGEIFAYRFEDYAEHKEKLLLLDDLYRTGKCRRRGVGWAHYHLMQGLNPNLQKVGPRFVEINDFTEDFDFPHDYDNWIAGRKFHI